MFCRRKRRGPQRNQAVPASEIKQFLEDESIRAARLVLAEFTAAFRSLARTPGKGHFPEDLTERKDLRFWPVYSYLIVYRERSRVLEIVAILHGKRNLRSVLIGRPN